MKTKEIPPHALALEFHKEITGWFKRDGVEPTPEMIENANDHYDANMAMHAAFMKFGVDAASAKNLNDEYQIKLWNRAWGVAALLQGVKVVEVTGDERAEALENNGYEGDEQAQILKVWRADHPAPREDEDFPSLYFFEEEGRRFSTVVLRDSIYCTDLQEIKAFLCDFWAACDE